MQCSIPSTTEFNKITQTFRPRYVLAGSVSVARVQPRTSKGITAFHNQHLGCPPRVWPVGPHTGGPVSWGISTYLKLCRCTTDIFACVAAAGRYFGSPQGRQSPLEVKRPLNQIVSLASPTKWLFPSRQLADFHQRDKDTQLVIYLTRFTVTGL